MNRIINKKVSVSHNLQDKLTKLRIISGKWRNRKLDFIHNINLRPTPERIRETVFNWITDYIHNAKILDCFAGSGIFAIEALSRGAARASIIDNSIDAINNINKNVNKLGIDNIDVIYQDCLLYLKANKQNIKYDLVFIDPPFHQNMLKKTCTLLHDNKFIHKNSLIYTETERDIGNAEMPENWKLIKSKASKSIRYQLWKVV
jgi:16S rRNA (guanine966-N2)-methyltransferase